MPPRVPVDLRLLAACLCLAGCATPSAYRQGQALMNEGRFPEALVYLEQAARQAPSHRPSQTAVIHARERVTAARLAQADTLIRQGQLEDAERLLRELASAQPTLEPAWQRLRELDRQRRIADRLAAAREAGARGDTPVAQAALRAILLDDPSHEAARRQLASMERDEARRGAQATLAEAYRKPITLEFRDAPLRSVFDLIARAAGLNFLFDKDVRTDQKTSIFLRNSTIESAVQLTLLTNQLEQRVLDANTVLIYPNNPTKHKDYQPLVVRSFFLANADAKAVAASLKTLLKSRDIVTDDKINLLILRDSPEAIRLAEKLVALHDVPEPEVMLEVEILEVKRTRLLDLGIRWPDQLTLTPLPSTSGTPVTLNDLRGLGGRTIGTTLGPATLSARRLESDANILANPRIRARNREKAKILIGERVPNITTTSTSTGFVAESVNYVDVGLKLDVEPTIYADGEVAIKVVLEVSNIISQLQTKSGSVAYQIGTRSAQTVLRLKDGENQVLAGLINDEDRRNAQKIPGLGDVPLIGRLFGGQADDRSKTEIVLSITPRILRNLRRPEGGLAEFDSGTENSLSYRPPSVNAAIPASAPAPSVVTAPAPAAQPGVATRDAVVPRGDNAPASAAPLSYTWQGPEQLKLGDVFSLSLNLQSDQPVQSIPLTLGFDARTLQVVSLTEGNFLRQDGAATRFASRVDPSGQILVTATRLGDTGATAPGALVNLQLRVVAADPPQARVQVLSASPIGVGGRSLAVTPVAPYGVRIQSATP